MQGTICGQYLGQQFFDEEVPCQQLENECTRPPEHQQFISDEPVYYPSEDLWDPPSPEEDWGIEDSENS